jgi:hypothetical protein
VSENITVSRTVDASPERLFEVLSDPSRHVEIDGSAMMRGLEGDPGRITEVGDQFVLNMNNDMLGDYQMRNTVTAFEPNRVIGWSPAIYPPDAYRDKLGDVRPGGHTYTWELAPAGEGRTTVTQTYDWAEVTDPGFRKLLPLLDEGQLTESIDKVARLAR